jgi:hypothetical protein
MTGKGDNIQETLLLPRNFSVSTAERIRAIIAGPPAYAVRKRKIEELEANLVAAIGLHEAKTNTLVDPSAPPAILSRSLALLHRLIEHHNAYYPIEANLPVHVATGEWLELGRRWRPLAAPSLEELIVRARTSRN